MGVLKIVGIFLAVSFASVGSAKELIPATMYTLPYCICCEGYAEHLEANGFEVEIKPVGDLGTSRKAEGVPTDLGGCNTIFVDGFIVKGSVSAGAIRRLLSERPAGVRGITTRGLGVPETMEGGR